jgi:diaminohydroxyphosphoribosylaminopyrimidine deaminase/5-amino-6-(5-phosphoribosylamino)uracil reductase
VAPDSKMKETNTDERWMDRALALARRGEGLTSPNPMVGAVLVRGGRKVGEGFHVYEKLKHAEIVALESAGGRARGATLYVNLEPCCHRGRTGPCTQAIIAAGVKRVVAAMRDPNPAVAGKGFDELRRAGITVEVGLREYEARELNETFAKWITTKLPFVTLKIAMTYDGKIAWHEPKDSTLAADEQGYLSPGSKSAAPEAMLKLAGIFSEWARSPRTRAALERAMRRIAAGKPVQTKAVRQSRWITSVQSRKQVQRLRHVHDAVLTGIGTVLTDDPLLTDRTKSKRRRPLLRVVLDSKLRLPLSSNLAESAKGDVIVFTAASLESPNAVAIRRAGVELVRVPSTPEGLDLRAALKELASMGVTSVLIEGGQLINSSALSAGIVDKLVRFVAPVIAGPVGLPAVRGQASQRMMELLDIRSRIFGGDLYLEGHLRNVYRNH